MSDQLGVPRPVTVEAPEGETTGRFLVLLADDAVDAGIKALTKGTGMKSMKIAGAELASADEPFEPESSTVITELGVAVMDTAPDQTAALGVAAAESSAIVAVEPERILYTFEAEPAGGLSADYLRGFRDAAVRLAEAGGAAAPGAAVSALAFQDTDVTWGLQATGAATSTFTGQGVSVAVLDTGLDLNHPDFAGRAIVSESFVAGETPQDTHGHGTHCCGTSCGTATPSRGPRYGIAHDAVLHVGKVLNSRGSGAEGDILAGVAWAIGQGCRVISMSLGRAVAPGTPPSAVFENAARRGRDQGSLIVAAAGNDSRRNLGVVQPVGHPANCPSVMAVAALDESLAVAPFSNGGIDAGGGQVDVAGPGVNVFSSWPAPKLFNTISGTSMATPHVAGLAALLVEANPGGGAEELSALITRHAKRLPVPSRDVGAGLAQAP